MVCVSRLDTERITRYNRPQMNTLERVSRFLSPKSCCRWGLNRANRERSQKLKAAQSLSKVERRDLINRLDWEVYEWADWLGEMEDKELVRRAKIWTSTLRTFLCQSPL